MLDLAIIIVNYNTRLELDACLRSVYASAGRDAYQVIVVDNRSSDGSVEMVQAEHPWVDHCLSTDHNGGYAYANNVGFRIAGYGAKTPFEGPRARHVLLLNPDTVLPPDALQQMVAFLDDHPDVGAVGPKLVRPDGSLDRACRRSFPTPEVSLYRLSGLSKLFPNSSRFGRYNLTYLDPDVQADVDSLVGAFMMMRGEALDQAGLLDETFFMYGEDIDLCYRIKQRGWRIVYNPAVTVLHLKGASSRKASTPATLAFYDAMRIFHNKHYRRNTFFLVNWCIDLGVALLRTSALLRNALRPSGRKRVASA
ncbi:MAG: glycosyltransferase family 2 protein [Anaerolineae bacterium]